MTPRAYKYRIYPNKEQEVLLCKTFGCVRWIWNSNVNIFNKFSKFGPNLKEKTSTEIKQNLEWMSEVSASALQQKERDFEQFKKQYFSKSRKKKIGRPQFKKKHSRQSFRLPNQKFEIDLSNHTIRLEKIGWIPVTLDRYIPKDSKQLSVTVSRDPSNKYFVSVLVEEEIKPKSKPTGKSVGVDLGLKHFLTLSSGKKVENPRWFRENQTKLARMQRRLSKKKKGSGRFVKCKLRVARLHGKIANQRKWFHHNIANELVKTYDFIGIEDLNIDGLKRNRKMAKSFSDAAFGGFANILKYKSSWNGGIVQEVNRFFPSSKKCSTVGCNYIYKDLTLDEREWTCPECGVTHDRDINASTNIEVEALNTAQGVACAQRTMRRCKTTGSVPVAVNCETSKKLRDVDIL